MLRGKMLIAVTALCLWEGRDWECMVRQAHHDILVTLSMSKGEFPLYEVKTLT